ncbi:MAG: hypothetical protein C0608_05290 [Deltaproteobacteria bacterium]|nr:MAG: hypothetical protein C0608_05290 [Deltaproteobacteria bacterium]
MQQHQFFVWHDNYLFRSGVTLSRLISAALAISLALIISTTSYAENIPSTTGVVRVGDTAPGFTLKTIDGKSEVCAGEGCTGKIRVLVFWSFFCFPCQAEMPDIDAYNEEIKGSDVEIIAIGLDGHEFDNFVLPFIAKHDLKLPLTYDIPTEEYYVVAEKYGVVGTPTFFVLDAEGKVRNIQLGRLEVSAIKAMVESARSKAFCSDIIKPGARKLSEVKPSSN